MVEAEATASPSRDRLLELATEIGSRLHRAALWDHGRALWLGDTLEPVATGSVLVHRDVGASLYDGTAGIGWFLAQLAALTDGEIRSAATADARGALRHALAATDAIHDPSLYAGTAGIGWASIHAGIALGDEQLAAAGLERLATTVVAVVERLDERAMLAELIGGQAGLALAALDGADRARGELARPAVGDRLEEAAHALGRALAAAARPDAMGVRWTTFTDFDVHAGNGRAGAPALAGAGPPLCGLGHGQSGPMLACAVLGARFGDPNLTALAERAASAERAWLSVERGGWPDLRGFDRTALDQGLLPATPDYWCHGNVGIGLARLHAYRLLGAPALLADATVALHLAGRAVGRLWRAVPGSYEANFSLCHGAAGLIELFVVAAQDLGDPGWTDAARSVTAAGLAHTDALGQARPAWPPGVDGGDEVPGLMIGLAGTGAALLRLAAPQRVGSPLLIGADVNSGAIVAAVLPDQPTEEEEHRARRRVVVKLDSAIYADQPARAQAAADLAASVSGARVERISGSGRVLLALPPELDPAAVAAALGQRKGVAYAEPDVVDRAMGEPAEDA